MNEIERSTPLPDADLLRGFLAVAEHANVTRASTALGRTQSAVSVQMRRLESMLGARLFHREARGVSLTHAGEQLVPVARRIVDDLGAVAAMFATPVEGRVRLGIPDDYGGDRLQGILTRFSRSHPGVEASVRCAHSTGFPGAISRGELDLAVYAAEPSEQVGRPLADEPTVWAAAGNWTRRPAEPLAVALFDRSCWWRDSAVAALAEARIPFRIVLESESAWGVKAAIASGLAVGVLSMASLEPYMRILAAADGFPALPAARLVLLEAGRSPSPAVSAMAEAIAQAFRPGG